MPQHIHTTEDGTKTSIQILDPENAARHCHKVGDEPTSFDEFGKGHTHIFKGESISGPIDIEEDDNSNEEPKSFDCSQHGKITQFKQINLEGVDVGIVAGYIATWDIDRGGWDGVKDRFARGAFRESLADLGTRNRDIRLKDHHGRTIGIFPIAGAFEDDRGLFATGNVNLDVQQGREAHSLVKQKAITDFSIGFTALEFHMEMEGDDQIRVITKAIIWEGSLVDEPMNPKANITEVKKYNSEDVDKMTPRELEKALKRNGFSAEAAKMIVKKKKENAESLELASEIKKFTSDVKQKRSDKELLNFIRQTTKEIS